MIEAIDTHGVVPTLRRYVNDDDLRQLVGQ
jgi:hypothetical protein